MHMPHKYASLPPGGLLVVKYGGNAMSVQTDDPVLAEVATFWREGTRVVIVHGGGPEIDRALERLGIATERIGGLRVTDAKTLEITEAVLCGTVNKRLVRACYSLGLPAVGVSGEDGHMLIADIEHGDLGYVGTIVATNARLICALLDAGYLPVVAPLGVSRDGSAALNVNADLSAGALAGALSADAFVIITNVFGIYRDVNDPLTKIPILTIDEAIAFAGDDRCQASMKPKVQGAVTAVRSGALSAYIGGKADAPVRTALSGGATMIIRAARQLYKVPPAGFTSFPG